MTSLFQVVRKYAGRPRGEAHSLGSHSIENQDVFMFRVRPDDRPPVRGCGPHPPTVVSYCVWDAQKVVELFRQFSSPRFGYTRSCVVTVRCPNTP